MPAGPDTTEQERLLRVTERIALLFSGAGIPRMAARVFAYVLTDDADRYTAAELAEGLRISPAAVSGAVRYLVDQRLLFRTREPGVRADVYRIYDDDVWSTIMDARLPLLGVWEQALDEAITEIGTGRRGGQRLVETKEFWAFMRTEMGAAMERWKRHRRSL